jgi:2-iminobutanoate/2-iminopropanoate deaminase
MRTAWVTLGLLLAAGCVPVAIVRRPPADPSAPYSASVTAGEWTHLAGQIGDPGGRFREEAESALRKVVRELRRAGVEPDAVVSVTVYLTSMDDYGAFNEVYVQHFPSRPARTCVAVAALPRGARVEVQAVARAR